MAMIKEYNRVANEIEKGGNTTIARPPAPPKSTDQFIPGGELCCGDSRNGGYACDFIDKSYCSLLGDIIHLMDTNKGWKHYKHPKCPGRGEV